MVYGGSSVVVSDDIPLVRASVCFKTFGKAESQTTAKTLFPRLKSIHLDSAYVSSLRSTTDLPFFANLRQGMWYFNAKPDGECRFRSTDGHGRAWTFHLSRSNIPFLLKLLEHKGAVVVDATRFGKTFPDSFNRTVPLWCCIINRALGFSEAEIELAPWYSSFEAEKITNEQLNEWAKQIRAILPDVLPEATLPLKPFWVANIFGKKDNIELPKYDADECIPVYCVSCSWANITGEEHRERYSWQYIPGAGDDEENWSLGLTPSMFWEHCDELISECENSFQCERKVEALVQACAAAPPSVEASNNTIVIVSELLHVIVVASEGKIAVTPSQLDVTWIKGMDKTWCRRYPNCWKEVALPRALKRFEDPHAGVFEIIAGDVETGLTMAIALLAVFFDSNFALLTKRAAPTKQSIKQQEAIMISRLGEGYVVPRRLVKEIIQHLPCKGF